MTPTAADSLTQVRMAYRLVQAYQRRVLDLVELVEKAFSKEGLELDFRRWTPMSFNKIVPRGTALTGRWAWDGLPLYHFDYQWSAEGRSAEAMGALVGIEFRVDDGYRAPTDASEPDPTTFPPAEECRSTIWVWGCACPPNAPRVASWDQRLVRLDEAAPDVWRKPLARIDLDGHPHEAGGFLLDAAEVATIETARTQLIDPTVTLARSLLMFAKG